MRDDELLHRFLLGELAEDEAESLELRLLQEDALFDLCEAIEGDLLAASVRGELTPAENERVLARLAASPGGRARLALAQDLAEMASAKPMPAPLPFRPPAGDPPRPAFRWAALAAGLLLAVGGFWVVSNLPETSPGGDVEIAYETPQPTTAVETPANPSQQPTAPEETPAGPPAPPPQPAPAPERPAAPEPAPRLKTAVFQLALATRRSAEPAEELPRFEVPKGTGEIEIQLDLEGEEQGFRTFNALVRSPEAGEVWSRQGLEPQPLKRETGLEWGTGLVLEIPADQLPNGRYEVEVQGVKNEGEAETIGVQEFEIVAD